ncbi:MAG: isoaspartyl peptidase/L-asparaginase, partial [Deltaproteobacteria bacterium]|nr:isoaspartyl peptidase/L-asparaginase [Deltaproteobacteria bacterium]
MTHGGAASPASHSDACVAAAEAAGALLERGADAMVAALEATRLLEDEPRFNAGTGSNLRLDGMTAQMDAAVMTSDLRFGAVACIEAVRNPILVAARVMETPHLMLVGE